MSYAQGGVIELRFLPWNRKMDDASLAMTPIAKARFPLHMSMSWLTSANVPAA
jgi:hypothetical protein